MIEFFIKFFSLVCLILIIGFTIYHILKSPFKYHYYDIEFDVSGKRTPNMYDYIDNYLISNGTDEFEDHYQYVNNWKKECQNIIEKSKLKKLRTKQYNEILDDANMFKFKFARRQTRYKQSNYVRTPYSVYIVVSTFSSDIDFIRQRYKDLAQINFECSLSEYHSKTQRKIMKKSLRDQIAFRDNYTCQICGKYMPDGVGLHVDHIIPIKSGGKSVPSNLRVLCSKCNGQKGSKIE